MALSAEAAGSRLLIHAGRVVTPNGIIDGAAVLVEGGRIQAVDLRSRFPASTLRSPTSFLTCPILMPGFIDMHAHGFGGHGFSDEQAAREASRLVARTGVTTWYAGLGHGATFEAIVSTVAAAASVVGSESGGARLAGIFMEGPYISVEKKGAWTAENLRRPSVEELQRLHEVLGGALRRLNVAPELSGALGFIRAARDLGIVVSVGHSNASYDQAVAAAEAGATIVNHTFNAMSGLVGATLTCESLLAELILDGVHVHPAAALALFRAKGAVGVALITDSSALTGMPDGKYENSGRTMVVAHGACRLTDGTLAGSVSSFDRDVRNARQWLTEDLMQLALISSGNAASAMGLNGETGTIAHGLAADLVLLDEAFEVTTTIVRGDVVYQRDGPR